MTGIGPITVLRPHRAENFLNLKALEGEALARMEQHVKSARETLVLADRLQGVRDTIRALWRLEDAMRGRSSLSGGAMGRQTRILDISL